MTTRRRSTIFTPFLFIALPTAAAFAFLGAPPTTRRVGLTAPPLLARGGRSSGGRKGLNNRRGTYGKNGEPTPTAKSEKRRKRNGSRGKRRIEAVESDVACLGGDGSAEIDTDSSSARDGAIDNVGAELAFGDAAATALLSNLGLNVADLDDTQGNDYQEEEEEEDTTTPPRIVWGRASAEYFWPPDGKPHPLAVPNDQGWPLLHLAGYLRGAALAEAMRLAAAADLAAEEVEQFEPGSDSLEPELLEPGEGGDARGGAKGGIGGGVLLRRSRVVNLAPPPGESPIEEKGLLVLDDHSEFVTEYGPEDKGKEKEEEEVFQVRDQEQE